MPDLVARSGVPIIFCPERNISGIMVTSWKAQIRLPNPHWNKSPVENPFFTCMLHRTKSSCQELTSGTYLTITLLKESK